MGLKKLGRANIYEDYFVDERGNLYKGTSPATAEPCSRAEAVASVNDNMQFNRSMAEKAFTGANPHSRAGVYTKNVLLDERLLEKLNAL